MNLNAYTQLLLPPLEAELKAIAASAKIEDDSSLQEMLSYHMGWNEGHGKAQGKRIRPLLVLLSTLACGGEWQRSLPAAAAVELIHNFSLIHDDIEDNSEYRRGRLTLWKKHNLPLALNAGDGMFTLAFIALQRSSPQISQEAVISAYRVLADTCLALTKGQHLDISFESEEVVSVEKYLQMIEGKTGALLAGSAQIGALLASASPETTNLFRELGRNLGLAFQIQDDLLGIWGDPAVTGKSAASDLTARKKSLPILFGLEKNLEFAQIWRSQEINEQTAPALAQVLTNEGALDYTQKQAGHYTRLALDIFTQLPEKNSAVLALEELANLLLKRSA